MSWTAAPHPDDPPRRAIPVDDGPSLRPVLRREPVIIRPRADTPQAQTLVLLPLLPLMLAMASVLFVGGFTASSVAGFAAVTAVVQWIVARRDVRILGDRGFAGQAPAVLALVSAVLYLGVRAVRSSGHDADAWSPMRWAIGTTAVAVLGTAVGLWFQASIGGILLLGN